MEMHQVRYFLAVAKHLNFTRAAGELRIAQPSLTRAVQKLEDELGGPLFRRERSNTHLTELGRIILPLLQATFIAAEAAKSQAQRHRKQDVGALALGVCAGTGPSGPIAFLVATIRKLVSLDVSVEVADAGTVERRLLAGELDAAVLTTLEMCNDRFDLHLIHSDDLVVAFPDGHRFSQSQSVTLEHLDAEPLVAHSGSPLEDALTDVMEVRGLTRLVRHRINEPRWLADFVRAGLGCAVVPAALAASYALANRNLDGVALRHRTMFATVAGRRHSPAVATLIQEIGISASDDPGDRDGPVGIRVPPR
jgi:DNA-binding transcriptional LysR family regulator